MKILHINASYKPAHIYGGPTMSVAKLCEQLVKVGSTIQVFTTTANGNTELPVNTNIKTNVDGVEVTYFKRITKDHSHFSPKLLINLWKRAPQFELVHIHGWWNLVSVFSALIVLMRNTPVLISPRGMLSSYTFNNRNGSTKKLFHNLLGRYILNRSYIHVTSKAEHNALATIIKPKTIFNIPNFVRIAQPENTSTVTNVPILKLLFLSRIEEKKGLDILLHALPLINVPYHLTIAGDGDKSYISWLKNIAHNNMSSNNISWIGFQDEHKFNVFRDHNLLVLPSYDENFGNVVIESLSVGTPVLISEHVGLADYVSENNLGWLCQTTPVSVAQMINNITLNCQSQVDQIRNIAPEIIQRDFNEDRLVETYINMYQQIIDCG